MRKAFAGVLGLVLLGVAVHASAAGAVEIKVLSTGNMVSILTEVTGEFERTSGHKLKIEYGSTTRMKSRIEADEAADLTINERFVLEDLLRQARIAGSIVDIARSPLGIGIRAGAAKPDVSSADALKNQIPDGGRRPRPRPRTERRDGPGQVPVFPGARAGDQGQRHGAVYVRG